MSENKGKDPVDEAPSGGSAATTPKATGDPLQGAHDDPNRVPSASAPTDPLSLAKMAAIPKDKLKSPTETPADTTVVKVINGQEAAATPPGDTGAFGAQLPPGGELMGGNITKTLDPPRDPATLSAPLTKERAALLSPVGRKLFAFVSRPPAEWGLIGPGETIRGHMLLLNLNTGEKTRGMDGHHVNEGELYANLRNFPESLATGDTIEQLLGAS